MRLLSPPKQAEILYETCRFLKTQTNFKIDAASDAGPCGSSVRIITGEEEGLFGWIAVNYLMDGFTGSLDQRTTYGFLDMGGASTQIAFEPSEESRKSTNTKDLIDVRLRLMGGEEISHKVFVTTWLGYGTNQARERYVGKAISEFEETRKEGDDVVEDPCLPKGLELTEKPVLTAPASSHFKEKHTLHGTGSFERCLAKSAPLLNKNKPCPDSPCLMNGVHVPPIDFSASHFIGVSEYWYSSEHIFNLGGAYDFVQYERAASEFCSRTWPDILKEHEESRKAHHLGGDGELEKGGEIVATGKWGPSVEIPRLQMQCFKAAWITNVLHEGLGMPRITDPGGNSTTDGEKVEQEAKKKGLGRPTFQSMDTVGDIAITWTLGKMVLEASKEVPPKNKYAKPLVDPIDNIEDKEHSHIQPIRPPFYSFHGFEDRITQHLPSSLHRDSLGFSPVFLVLLVFMMSVMLFVCYPLRRQLRTIFLRSMRSLHRQRDPYDELMEEGRIGGGSRPASPTLGSKLPAALRHLFPTSSKPPPSPLSLVTNGPAVRNFTTRATPYPSLNDMNDSPTGSTSQYMHAASISRAPSRTGSPAPSMLGIDEYGMNGLGSAGSRSRNASQLNIGNGSLTPRPVAMSRSSSFGPKNFS